MTFGGLGFWVLGEYPFLGVLLLTVSPLRRVPFSDAKKEPKGCALTFGPLAGARGSFAPGSIRAQRLRFASLHLLSLCLAAPNGRCAPTPGSIPALSLPMGCQIKSCTRACAHCVEWGGFAAWGVNNSSCGGLGCCDDCRPADQSLTGCTESNCGIQPCWRWRPDSRPISHWLH